MFLTELHYKTQINTNIFMTAKMHKYDDINILTSINYTRTFSI